MYVCVFKGQFVFCWNCLVLLLQKKEYLEEKQIMQVVFKNNISIIKYWTVMPRSLFFCLSLLVYLKNDYANGNG